MEMFHKNYRMITKHRNLVLREFAEKN
jgi:hypothetical protein